MSLRRRLAFCLVLLLACTGVLGAAALAGLAGLGRHFDAAEAQYGELRALYEIGHHAAIVRLLAADGADEHAIRMHVAAARAEIARLGAVPDERVREIDRRLQLLSARAGDPGAAAADTNALLGQIAASAGAAKRGIIDNRRRASERLEATVTVIGVLYAVVVLLGLAAGIALYRAVMKPVRAVARAASRIARAKFGERIPERGPRELRGLIRRFNRMSEEIGRLHLSMEEEVDLKSRQLIRSEQLAGVGCLAAGIAHEVNNPLGIMAGYAEATLRHLEADDVAVDGPLRARIEEALAIIRDEAFRCREITQQLLDMARPSDDRSVAVPIAAVVRRATSLVGALPVARDRAIRVCVERTGRDVAVRGNEGQLLQVLINLLTNGLEACAAGTGEVVVTVERRRDDVLVAVADTGCGMTDAAVARAFDPFFTSKPARGLAGTGLGLSVSHAIVERHGGRLFAVSPGPDRGSTFTLQLPAAVGEVRLDACA